MFYSIDRFEAAIAVLVGDDGKQYDVPRTLLPSNVAVGDILRRAGQAYVADAEETARRRTKIQGLLDKLAGRG